MLSCSGEGGQAGIIRYLVIESMLDRGTEMEAAEQQGSVDEYALPNLRLAVSPRKGFLLFASMRIICYQRINVDGVGNAEVDDTNSNKSRSTVDCRSAEQ